MEGDSWWEEHCSVISPEPERLIIVGFIGSILATVSAIFNAFLFYSLLSIPATLHCHLLYLTLLAFFDTFLSGSYILLFPVNVFMDFFESEFLTHCWYAYLRIMLAACHVAISTSALLITTAAFERYLIIVHRRFQFRESHRIMISALTLIFALICKAPMYFEVEVLKNENCTGITALRATLAEWAVSEPYQTVYRFWFRNVITVFLPFFLILYFNLQIVYRLRHRQHGAELFRFPVTECKKNVRAATRMLVMVSCTYLASNALSVLISAWEFADIESTMSDSWRSFYSLCSDLVSLLTIVACVLRLPIYCASNLKIRNEVLENFYRLISYKKGYNRLYLRKRQTRCNETMRYCNSENGFVVPQSNADGTKSKCVGTLFDKIALSVALSSNLRKNDNEFGEEVDDEMEDEDDGMRKENEEKAKKSTFL